MRSKRALSAAIESLEFRRLLAAITVTTTADDLTATDGSVSLREAITAIDLGNDLGDPDIQAQNPGAFGTDDTIHFNIPGTGVQTIKPASALPLISKSMVIDGTSQPGFDSSTNAPIIELDGESAGATNGLSILGASAGHSTIRGLVINRFQNTGIYVDKIAGDTNNLIVGNYLGVDPTGTIAEGNGDYGVFIANNDNTIGGTSVADRNVISGNKKSGIGFDFGAPSGNMVLGNYIGTDATGTAALGNQMNGIEITAATSNTFIGGETVGAGNLISGNVGNGVSIFQSDHNTLEGNFIGTDVTGEASIPNGNDGVVVSESQFATIGGTTTGDRNVISGNTKEGIFISSAANNIVQGNYIGTDATGMAAIPNGGEGVDVAGPDNLVGGLVSGARNIISGNSGDGVSIGFEYTDDVVQGNYIGTDATGAAPVPNHLAGVIVRESAVITIGGSLPEAANVIAFNGGAGVDIVAGSDTVLVRLNSIFSNGGIGIDLHGDGVSPNDAGDVDSNPSDVDNHGQNFPVLASALSTASGTTIQGLLNSNSNQPYLIDFYSNDTFDPTGYGEGQTYIGSVAVTTDSSGNATFNLNVPVASLGGKYLSATATLVSQSGDGETSEFSQDIQIAPKDKPLALGSVFPVSAVEGKGFSGTLVRFTDPDAQAIAGDYSAAIDWGDGTTSAGTVSAASSGGFDVKGSHTYAEEGTDPVKITINDTAGRNDAGGESLIATTSATVADAALHASGKTISANEGRLFAGTVATFTDENLSAPLGDFTAQINWGDGHTTTGTVFQSSAGHFFVTGGHAYDEASSKGYTVTTTIHDTGGSNATAKGTAKIGESPLDQGTGKSLQVNANTSFTNLTLGTFRDQDSLNTKPSDYSGTINWGDGKTSSVKFVFNGSTFDVGSFWKVQGSHKYTAKKTYSVNITLFDTASTGAKLTITSTIKVV